MMVLVLLALGILAPQSPGKDIRYACLRIIGKTWKNDDWPLDLGYHILKQTNIIWVSCSSLCWKSTGAEYCDFLVRCERVHGMIFQIPKLRCCLLPVGPPHRRGSAHHEQAWSKNECDMNKNLKIWELYDIIWQCFCLERANTLILFMIIWVRLKIG